MTPTNQTLPTSPKAVGRPVATAAEIPHEEIPSSKKWPQRYRISTVPAWYRTDTTPVRHHAGTASVSYWCGT